jgi:hypothetical protein
MIKQLVIGTLFLVSTSCNSVNRKSGKNTKDSVKQTIQTLRTYGFFSEYKSLNDEQLFDSLHQQRIAEYTEIFGYTYDPGMELEIYEVLQLDRKSTVSGDTESDVGKGNNQYITLLKAFSEASAGFFQPTEITEIWEHENGPIHVSFKDNGEVIKFNPTYHDDWLSEEVFAIINQQMMKRGDEKFYLYLGKDGWGLGQFFFYIRMNQAQKKSLENAFGWKFF